MNISNYLLVNPQNQVVAFCGERTRISLIKCVAGEFAKNGQKILLASNASRKLPISGATVVSRDISILIEQLSKEFQKHSIVYIGKELQGKLMQGFELQELQQLKVYSPADYVFIDLECGLESLIYDHATIQQWIKTGFWDQLVYCLDISWLDQPIDEQLIENLENFKIHFPRVRSLSQNVLIRYLTHPQKGIKALFEQPWKTLLFFSGINLMTRENRTISFARELQAVGIQHIVMGDIQSNTVKKIQVISTASNGVNTERDEIAL